MATAEMTVSFDTPQVHAALEAGQEAHRLNEEHQRVQTARDSARDRYWALFNRLSPLEKAWVEAEVGKYL